MSGIDPIFSFKPSFHSEQAGDDLMGDITQTLETVSVFIDTVSKVVSSIFKFAFGAFQETKDVDYSTLRSRDVKVVPTSVENMMGKKMASKVCDDHETEKGTLLDDWLQGVGNQLLKRTNREGLAYQFILKKDHDANAFVVPGGKMILTTGLVEKLKAAERDDDLASVLSYLIARSERSEEVKSVQTGALMHLIGKISGTVSGYLFPENVEDRKTAKKNRAVNELVDQGVGLGTQALLHRQQAEAEEASRTRAAQLLAVSGFEVDRSSLNKTLDDLLDKEEAEDAYQEDVHEQLGSMIPNLLKIFV